MVSQEVILLAFVILVGIYRLRVWSVKWRSLHPKPVQEDVKKFKTDTKADDAQEIIPLPSFNWRRTEPIKFRPFKPKYHLTMAVQNSPPSELIEMDNTYLTRLAIRKQIMDEHSEIALAASPVAIPAINELYVYLTNIYLPIRYPTMFSLSEHSKKTKPHLLNLVTDTKIPLVPFPDPLKTLRTLGENIDEDFLILLPSEDGDGYVLKGYVTCFPAGFNTREKFEMKLRDIHGPVPGYKEKLEKSMDRFFEKLEVGRLVKRINWSITTHDRLYAASGGNHLYEGEEPEVEETYLRCERQMLHRLPQTKALVFSFKTYLYPIRDIKEEGLGDDLATAIDGLKEGSVPAMHFYKRGVIWGEAVKEFLRS